MFHIENVRMNDPRIDEVVEKLRGIDMPHIANEKELRFVIWRTANTVSHLFENKDLHVLADVIDTEAEQESVHSAASDPDGD